jgi:hypothetical protein
MSQHTASAAAAAAPAPPPLQRPVRILNRLTLETPGNASPRAISLAFSSGIYRTTQAAIPLPTRHAKQRGTGSWTLRLGHLLDIKNAVGALPEIGLFAMADGGGAQRVAAQARCEHARTRWD